MEDVVFMTRYKILSWSQMEVSQIDVKFCQKKWKGTFLLKKIGFLSLLCCSQNTHKLCKVNIVVMFNV